MFYLALSCLQGRPMRAAFDELIAMADGVQLTPGNHPTPEFHQHTSGHNTRTHHGFSFTQRAVRVWNGRACCVDSVSVHPPSAEAMDFSAFAELEALPVLETMYPGYRLGCGEELRWAMDNDLDLAVDVSHLFIQRCAGVLTDSVWRRLSDYDRIEEIHISGTDGLRDEHSPVRLDTFGLDWVRDRESSGSTVILECYMHQLNDDERLRQIELVLG